jgi:hypothetical protein
MRSKTGQILLSWGLGVALSALFIVPDLLLRVRTSLLRYQDYECDYMAFFTFLTFLSTGGFKLWNSYDQAPLMLYYVAGGLFSVHHLWGAIAYELLKGLTSTSGEAFHVVASIIPSIVAIKIIAIGAVLLLRRFTNDALIVITCASLCGSLLAYPILFGANGRHIIYFYPLLAHLFLQFAEDRKPRDLLLFGLALVVCCVSSPFIGPGYFYTGLHFFILPVAIWALLQLRTANGWRMPERLHLNRTLLFGASGVLLVLMTVLLAGPLVYLIIEAKPDVWFGWEGDRLRDPLSLSEYFERPSSAVARCTIFLSSLDWGGFKFWYRSWSFLGFSVVFFSIAGVILSDDKRRFIFLSAIVCLWLLNGPKIPGVSKMPFWFLDYPSHLVHWVNNLTNPGKFLVRSLHQPAAFSIPFYLAPLMVLGLDCLFAAARSTRTFGRRGPILLALTLPLILGLSALHLVMGFITTTVFYQLAFSCLLGVVLLVVVFRSTFSTTTTVRAATALTVVMLVVDLTVFSVGARVFADDNRMIAHTIPGLEYAGPIYLDHQNPEITPFSGEFRVEDVGEIPWNIALNAINQQGVLYRYINLGRWLAPGSEMADSRHVSYAGLASNWGRDYLQARDPSIFGFAQRAERDQPGKLEEITRMGLLDEVVVLEGQTPFLQVATNPTSSGVFREDPATTAVRYVIADLTGRTENGLRILEADLPSDFPGYLASSVFSRGGQGLTLTGGGHEFRQAQGKLAEPFSFDVQNMTKGRVHFALPARAEYSKSGTDLESVLLTYPTRHAARIGDIHRLTSDLIEFDHEAPAAGWLVIHYPYDRKWSITIDGAKQELLRANRAFMATRVPSGVSKVSLEYWPETRLRFMLGASYLLLQVVFVVILCLSVRRAR